MTPGYIAKIRSAFAGSDKTGPGPGASGLAARNHRYEHLYSLILPNLPPGPVLEIGYYRGEGLAGFGCLLPGRELFAIDLTYGLDRYKDAGITRFACDTGDPVGLLVLSNQLAETLGDQGFALIVDDGSHQLLHQQLCLQFLRPLLALGGYYVIEDLPDLEQAYEFADYPGFMVVDTRPIGQSDDICVVMSK